MSTQREVEAGDTLAVVETKSAKKARLAEVLDRGFISYRLNLDYLDKSIHGEWARNDPNEIARLNALGFSPYKGEVDPNLGLKKEADGTYRVGDVILMCTDKETKELLDEIKADRIKKLHGTKPQQAEEQGFNKEIDYGIKPIHDSRIEEVGADQILSAIKES